MWFLIVLLFLMVCRVGCLRFLGLEVVLVYLMREIFMVIFGVVYFGIVLWMS